MGSCNRPLKSHHLATAVIGHGETLLVKAIYMAVAKVQHFMITYSKMKGNLTSSRATK